MFAFNSKLNEIRQDQLQLIFNNIQSLRGRNIVNYLQDQKIIFFMDPNAVFFRTEILLLLVRGDTGRLKTFFKIQHFSEIFEKLPDLNISRSYRKSLLKDFPSEAAAPRLQRPSYTLTPVSAASAACAAAAPSLQRPSHTLTSSPAASAASAAVAPHLKRPFYTLTPVSAAFKAVTPHNKVGVPSGFFFRQRRMLTYSTRA